MSGRRKILVRLKTLIALNTVIVFGLLLLLAVQVNRPSVRSFDHDDEPFLSDTTVSEPSREGGSVHPAKLDSPSHFQQSQPPKVQVPESEEPIGRIALVVDDLGFSAQSSVVQGMLKLPVPFTASVIPGQVASRAVAVEAHSLGHEVIAHVPMKPLNLPENTRIAYLNSDMNQSEYSAFMDAVVTLPYARGLSNHQGSAATQDSVLMDRVAKWCSRQGWYVFDSITHAGTLLYQSARAQGVQALRRDIFLDHHPQPDSIRARLQDAVDLAKLREGVVCVIAHPRTPTLQVLQQELPRMVEQGVEFVRLSEGLERKPTMAEAGVVR